MSVFDAIAKSLPVCPDDSARVREHMVPGEAVERTSSKPVLQFAPSPVMLDTAKYVNALSDSNPNGDLLPLLALRNLIDPLPSFAPYYNASGNSTEQTYETVIQGAMAKADNPSITTLLAQARERFDANRFARVDGLAGWWRPVYIVPEDWHDLSRTERFQDLRLDLSDQGNDGAYAMIGGVAPLQLSVAGQGSRKPLDPQTEIRSLRMKYLLVSFRRPWFNPLLFQYTGWYLSQQGSGFCSSGDLDTNTGILPLLPTGMLLAKEVAIDVAWGRADQDFLDAASASPSAVSLGPFSLQAQPHDSSVQVVAWISSLIPYSPKDTDLREGSILLTNRGSFTCRFSVAWSQSGKQSASESGNLLALAAKSIGVPAKARGISVTVDVMTFPWPVETWKTVATLEFSAPVRKCFELSGETFNFHFREVACIG